MKGTWKQRLQLVGQLDSCFVSSTHPLSHTLMAILLSSISPLPFTCSFMLCFCRGVAFCMKSHLRHSRRNILFPFNIQKAFMYSSLFLLFIAIVIASPSYFSLLTVPRLIIHHRETAVTSAPTYTSTHATPPYGLSL